MAKVDTSPATQLYLVLELANLEPAVDRLKPILDGEKVPSLLILPAPNRSPDVEALQAFIAVAQHAGVAVLIDDDAQLAATVGADGVHISADSGVSTLLDRYSAARDVLGPKAIVGAQAGDSRHDAMAVGEAGADYIAFGLPASSGDDSEEDSEDAQLGQVAWWADIFEIPVVALDVFSNERARDLADADADFIALKVPAGLTAADLRDWLEAAQNAIASR